MHQAYATFHYPPNKTPSVVVPYNVPSDSRASAFTETQLVRLFILRLLVSANSLKVRRSLLRGTFGATVSFGIAGFRGTAPGNFSDLVTRADAAFVPGKE